jgi:hypothetical protein
METAERMRFFVQYLLKDNSGGIEYRKIETAFKTVFAGPNKEG